MKLQIVTGYTKPKARLDPYFIMKAEIVRFCRELAHYETHERWKIVYLKNRLAGSKLLHYINNYWLDLMVSIEFDKRFFQLLLDNAEDYRQGYWLITISNAIIEQVDGYTTKPVQLPLPLYYDNALMDTLYKKSYWMKVERDYFDHEAMILAEPPFTEPSKYFAILNPYASPYPIFTQPFVLTNGDFDHLFTPYNTTFDKMYQKMRGLFKLWYGINFEGYYKW